MREPKPHVITFVAAMVFVAGVSTAADRVAVEEQGPGVTIDQVAAPATGDETATTGPTTESATDTTIATPTPLDGAAALGASVGSGATGTISTPPAGQSGSTSTGSGTTAQPAAPQQPAAQQPAAQQPAAQQPAGQQPPAGQPPTSPEPTASQPAPAQQPAAATYPEANLYDANGKVRGITDDEIVMCGHAALALGAAFDTSKEDLNVYWDMVNETGGVHGRSVRMSWEDDAYVSSEAIRAATTCADKDPFMILGGIGFDQIPGVRDWAEANDELYLHHIAVAPTKNYDYSYSLSPTVQLVGQESGNFISRAQKGSKVGVIYRNTDNWKPGSDAGIAVMEANGLDVTPYPITQNQGVYAQELNQMQLAGVEVVWIWENALNAAQILNQADELEYYPTWIVFPFQTTIDILNNPGAHTIEGVAAWGAYVEGGYGGRDSNFGVDAEIARFEAAYAKFRPGTTPNDLLWQVWVGNIILERMLTDCGASCNRNVFAGMMLSGYQVQVNPGCQINFADQRSFGGHHGGFGFFSQELFFPPSGPAYRTTSYCATTLK